MVAPIPIPPLRPSDEFNRTKKEGGPRRPGRFRRSVKYLGSPIGTWAGIKAIRASADLVGTTIREARAASKRDPRFLTFPDGHFDYEATAVLFGISVQTLRGRLAHRRRQTGYLAYGCLLLALTSCVVWLTRAFGDAPATVMFTLNAFGFSAICLLAAFYQALVNYQIRSERTASWRDFMLTDHGFWPTL